MAKFFKSLLPRPLYRRLLDVKMNLFGEYAHKSYAQEGEDMVLRRIFENKLQGFYVDVGAYHPKRFSNTYFFYRRGWKGINIDAMPGSMKKFSRTRSRDINLEIPVSDARETLIYYAFDEPALNGFIKDTGEARAREKDNVLLFKKEMETRTLKEILDTHLPPDTAIDFMSVDVEGLDLRVLQSNDWSKYSPRVILVEMLDVPLENFSTSEIYRFLKENRYQLFAKTYYTYFFMHHA